VDKLVNGEGWRMRCPIVSSRPCNQPDILKLRNLNSRICGGGGHVLLRVEYFPKGKGVGWGMLFDYKGYISYEITASMYTSNKCKEPPHVVGRRHVVAPAASHVEL
jgi:hypothetical protein